ncbi:MAG: YkvA family protein [Longimicrobiales bacterium]
MSEDAATPESTTDKIRDFLSNSDIVQKAQDPATYDAVRAGFGDAFEQVKEKLGDSWEDVQSIYEMAFDEDFDLKKETKWGVVAALAYLVSPVDLLPEKFMGAMGYADDVAVLLFALNQAQPEIERYRSFKAPTQTAENAGDADDQGMLPTVDPT